MVNTNYFWNYLAALFNINHIIQMKIKQSNLISIMKCSTLYSGSCKKTGSRFATGVIAPVLPTWNETDNNLVDASSALYL